MENVGVDEVGEVGDAPEQAAAKTQKPITTYRMCCPQRDSVSEARFNKWLRLDGLIFLNSYRRRRRAAALKRRNVTAVLGFHTQEWRPRKDSNLSTPGLEDQDP